MAAGIQENNERKQVMAIWTLGIADIHAGSNFALIPPHMARRPMKRGDALERWKGAEKKHPGHVDMQLAAVNQGIKESKKFWNQFESMLMKLPKIDYAFIVSDNIEGKQHKSEGIGLLSSAIKDQTFVASYILDHIYKYAKWKGYILLRL